MKNLILTAALAVATIVGGLAWTDTAEAQRVWVRGRAPAVGYYRPYYRSYYRPYYRSYYGPYYGYRSYYRPYSYGSYYYYGYPRYYGYRPYSRWW